MGRPGLLLLSSLALLACRGEAQPLDAGPSRDAALDGGALEDAGSTPDGGVVPDAGPGPHAELEVVCGPIAAHLCEEAARCGCGAVLPGGELDGPACTSRWLEECIAAYGGFLELGARLDAVRARACAELVIRDTPSCARPDGVVFLAVCEPFLLDPAAIGEPCLTPHCADGAGICRDGQCAARATAGEGCAGLFSCATGLICSDRARCEVLGVAGASCRFDLTCAPPLRCVSGRCQPLAPEGQPCGRDEACGYGLVCADTSRCERKSACEDGICGNEAFCGSARACGPRGDQGAPCLEDRSCAPSLFCDGSGRCAPRPGAGQDCGPAEPCAPGLACAEGTWRCGPLPGAGESCAFGDQGTLACAAGLGCDDELRCVPLPGEGAPCTVDSRCAEGLGCDFRPDGSICVLLAGAGAPCETDRTCRPDHHCGWGGVCVADLPDGSPCRVGNECAGACGPHPSGGLVCRPRPGAGDPCLFAEECGDGLTCSPVATACLPPICEEL